MKSNCMAFLILDVPGASADSLVISAGQNVEKGSKAIQKSTT